MRGNQIGRGGLQTVALALAAWPAAGATAAEPACFPERTVLTTTELQDATGHAIGAIRNARQVAVVADRVGFEGRWAEIAIREPIELRAFVRRENLKTFLREDFPIEASRIWWMAGAPMNVHGGDSRIAEVTRDGADEDAPKLTVRCALLTGSFGSNQIADDSCHCSALPAHRTPAGTYVWFEKERKLKVDLGKGYGSVDVDVYEGAGLLERKGDEVLVEALDPWRFLRVRRWTPAAGMMTELSGGRGVGTISLCSEIDLPLGKPGGRLAEAVPVRADTDAEPFATLPPGTEYRVLQRWPPDVKIVVRWPAWELKRYTVDVRGWVPAAMLPVPGADRRRKASRR